MVQCEILMIGSELLLGQILDTNAQVMARHLAENGINLYQKTTVGDNLDRIKRALSEALSRSDVILTSGGLGPTEDDITRECVAALVGQPLEFRQELFDVLAARFARFKASMTENNKKQAYAPRGAIAIENPHGTAPGLIVETDGSTIISMPAVPWELEPMLTERVIPYLRQKFDINAVIHSRVLKVCGMGESRVDDAIGDLMRTQANPTIGVLASPDAVRIRLSARAGSKEDAEILIDSLDRLVRDRLPGLVLAEHETPEAIVDQWLVQRKWNLAISEYGTGGMLAHRFTMYGGQAFVTSIVLPAEAASKEILRTIVENTAEQAPAALDAQCALVVAVNVPQEYALACFVSPNGQVEWELPFLTGDERARIRLATTIFERLRRHLLGITSGDR